MMTHVKNWLARVGHLWVENPLSLVRFGLRLVQAVPYALQEVGSRRVSGFLSKNVRHTVRAFMGNIVPSLITGVFAGGLAGVAVRQLGQTLRPLFDTRVLPLLLGDVLPLVLAIVMVFRGGASIASGLSLAANAPGQPSGRVSNQAIQDVVLPGLLSMTLSAGVLFVLLAGLTVWGYLADGLPDRAVNIGVAQVAGALRDPLLEHPLLMGVIKSVAFGWIVAYVSAALGIQAAERTGNLEAEFRDWFGAVWESGVTSLIICSLLTVLLWQIPV